MLQDISLHVDQGEIVGLLGPNGAGKTICFYAITGMIAVDAGRILLGTTDATDLTMSARALLGLGYLPQEASIFRGMSSGAIIEPDLIEWNYGDYEGRRSVDIRRERPEWAIYRDGCPGGETPAEISDRADQLIGKLDEFGSSIALFSHGQFACSLAARWVGLDIIEAEHFALDTASISILGHSRSRPGTRVIELWNFVPGRLAAPTQANA